MAKSIRTSYKTYTDNSTQPVEKKEYVSIANGFMKFVMDKVLDGENVKLPVKFGSLYISGKKVNPKLNEEGKIINLAPDWVKTKQLWETCEDCKKDKQLVYHFNEHTNGIKYRYNWSKKNLISRNKILYSLVLSRSNKRALFQKIKEGKEYIIYK